MRKMQKNQILEIMDSLQQAHEEIRKALWQKNSVLAQDIICECQKTAVSIGESIESSEGENHVTVSYLEEYCELLFGIYEEIGGKNTIVSGNSDVEESVAAADKASVNGNKTYKSLRRQLIKIENSVRDDIPAKKEVVFFPYKASMWDSLESVYLAAKEDPDCDAYCVPIPYYDLNPDRSFGEMHDEKNQYPENIEITDWQTYRFEERRPDEIYIHNGYDNWNLVTSVHPRFYSGNLKKYTEKLIYIPYFVLNEIEPDNQAAIEDIKHFCFMPGIINADKVIVQSEKMKQIYVNEYLKAAKENGMTGKHLDREHLERKFLGLGSPKIDKVLNTKKEDLEIPDEWLKIIQKPDGSFKKIVFYNTGISALLAHNEKWVEKIEDVLEIFKENQEDVALLWRPHPLIENTMRSMRPGILERYQQLKRQYLEEGWGIYDDTADVDRAVVLSDVYYGDGSSVVQMYRQTRKTVLIQDVGKRVVSNKENLEYTMSFNLMVDNERYCLFTYLPILGKMNPNKKNINIEYIFENENLGQGNLYANMLSYHSIILLVPMHAKHFVLFNSKTKQVKFKEIPNREWQQYQYGYFLGACLYDKYAIVVGYTYQGILSIDMETFEITVYSDWGKEYQKHRQYDYKNFFVADVCLCGSSVFLPMQNANIVAEFELQAKKMYFHTIDMEKQFIRTVCHDGEFFWLTGSRKCLMKWDSETNIVEEYEFPFDIRDYTGLFFTKSWYGDNKIYLHSNQQKKIYIIDLSDMKQYREESVEKICLHNKELKYIYSKQTNGNIYIEQTEQGVGIEYFW